MDIAEAKAMLPEILNVMQFASPEWVEGYDVATGKSQICGRDKLDGEVFTLATLSKSIPTDDRELMRKAPVYIRALLTLRAAAIDEYRKVAPKQPEPEKPRKKTPSQICWYLCERNGQFRRWLMECKDLHDAGDAERIKTHVRFLLTIDSLGKIDTDPLAAKAWSQMLSEFNRWRNAG